MQTSDLILIVVVILIAMPLCFLGFVVIRQSFQVSREIKHILKNGVPAEATVSSIRQTNTEINGHPEVFIGLTIPREHAEPYRTIIKAVIYMVNIPQYQPGRKVKVKVLNTNGKIKVALEGAQVF
ncbi:uncharacterized protein YbbK (DUF523 family) [Paenibacillus castaneae]|uniref:hypothetical protein n=1 Tax=Paenibacillus castaneae TaxID=474957 RepID=UPI000C9BCED2|nr:hypothetical protein [Paenibacillus castaneae]NIK78252.1 uncharacterized protein YbbK (DUF523 family) [Paenibacillus castaneae]